MRNNMANSNNNPLLVIKNKSHGSEVDRAKDYDKMTLSRNP